MSSLPAPARQPHARIPFWRFVALGTAIGTAVGFARFAVIVTSNGLPSTLGEFVGAIGWLLWVAIFFMLPLILVGLIGGITFGVMSPLFSAIRQRALATTIYAITNVIWYSGAYAASLWVLTGSVPLATYRVDFIVEVLATAIASAVLAPWVLFRQR